MALLQQRTAFGRLNIQQAGFDIAAIHFPVGHSSFYRSRHRWLVWCTLLAPPEMGGKACLSRMT